MISREELYALVWNAPGRIVAIQLGVSDPYLGKICAALHVPRPGRGWWKKRAAGTAPPPPPLPPPMPGFAHTWRKAEFGVPPIRQSYRVEKARAFNKSSGIHPHAQLAISSLFDARPSADGTHLVPRGEPLFDLTLSRKLIEPALSLADALYKRLEERGHLVTIAEGFNFFRPKLDTRIKPARHTPKIQKGLWSPRYPTVTIVRGVPIGLAIMEVFEEVLMRYVGYGEYVPASSVKEVNGISWTEWQIVNKGILKVVAYSPYRPAPWQREWVVTRPKSAKRVGTAIVEELESLSLNLPHAGFFLSDQNGEGFLADSPG